VLTSLRLFTLIGFLAAGGAGAAETPATGTVVYLGATLLDGLNPGPQPDVAIVTQGERITAVTPAAQFHPDAGATVVDVHGKFIVPGLINTHVHLATLAEPPVARAYLRRELYSGVTTVRDMAGDARLLVELQREAQFGEVVSPDIYFAALMAGPEFFKDPRTHDAARGREAGAVPWMQAITDKTDLPLAVAQARGTGATGIKIYADLPASLVSAITAEAHRQHMLVWAHAAVFPARPSEVVDAGVDVVSHACLLGYEIAVPTEQTYHDKTPVPLARLKQPNATMDALFADMKRRDTILDATLSVYEDSPSKACPLGINDYLAGEANRAGIAISTGTDDDADWSSADSALDTEIELMVHKLGMSPAQAIHSATLVGARTVGMEKDSGSIEAGKLASLVVLDRDPLVDIANVRSVNLVVRRGLRYPRSAYKPVTVESMKNPQ
jgi:imidazolonepropionase-like amidohydrolase